MIKGVYDFLAKNGLFNLKKVVLTEDCADMMETNVQKMFLQKFVDGEWDSVDDVLDYVAG